MVESGFIYILFNPAMAGIIKIGKTTRSPEDRANELSSGTNVPLAFEIVYRLEVKNVDVAEKIIHKKLEKYRINKSREFFKLSIEQAIKETNEHLKDYKYNSSHTISPFVVNDTEFYKLSDLMMYFNSNYENFEKGLKHLEEGNIQDWLDRNHDYDMLLLLQDCLNANKEYYETFFDLYFKIIPTNEFILFGEIIDLKKLNKPYDKTSSNKGYDFINYSVDKFERIYKIYKNVKSKNNEQLEKYIELKRREPWIARIFIEWILHPNNYFLKYKPNISTSNIEKILSKVEIDDLETKRIIPYNLLKELKSEDLNAYISAFDKIFEYNGRSIGLSKYSPMLFYIRKDDKYEIPTKLYNKLQELPLAKFEDLYDVLIDKNKFEEWQEKYYIPEILIEGIKDDDYDVFTFCSSFIKLACLESSRYIRKHMEKLVYVGYRNDSSFYEISNYNRYKKSIEDELNEKSKKAKTAIVEFITNRLNREILFEKDVIEHTNKFLLNQSNKKIKDVFSGILSYKNSYEEILTTINPIVEQFVKYFNSRFACNYSDIHKELRKYADNYNAIFKYLSNYNKSKYLSEPFYEINLFNYQLDYFFVENKLLAELKIISNKYQLHHIDIVSVKKNELEYCANFLNLYKDGLVIKTEKKDVSIFKDINIETPNLPVKYSEMFMFMFKFKSQYSKEIFTKEFVNEIVLPNDLINQVAKFIKGEYNADIRFNIRERKLWYIIIDREDKTNSKEINDVYKFIYKKNIPILIEKFYFPSDIEEQLYNLTAKEYIEFVRIIMQSGIVLFSTYQDIESETVNGYVYDTIDYYNMYNSSTSIPNNSKIHKSMIESENYRFNRAMESVSNDEVYTTDLFSSLTKWIILEGKYIDKDYSKVHESKYYSKNNLSDVLITKNIVNKYIAKNGKSDFVKVKNKNANIKNYSTFHYIIKNQIKFSLLEKAEKLKFEILNNNSLITEYQKKTILDYMSNRLLATDNNKFLKEFTKKDEKFIKSMYYTVFMNPISKIPFIKEIFIQSKVRSIFNKYSTLFDHK